MKLRGDGSPGELRRTLYLLAGILFVVHLAAGCQKQKEDRPAGKTFGQQELLVGLIPEQNIFRQRSGTLCCGRICWTGSASR